MDKKDKISGFKIPEDYFTSLEVRLQGILEEDKFPKEPGFTVPDQYFAQLEEKVFAQAFTKKPEKVVPLFPKKFLAYAAAIAACAIFGIMIFDLEEKNTSVDSVQLTLIDKYVDEGNLNFDLYDLTSYLETDEISKIDLSSNYISQATLKDYLLENAEESIFLEEEN